MASKYEIDMSEGPLTKKIIRFAVPLMLSSVLQLLFNAADMVVVGQFAGSDSLAAVGSTGALNNLIINLFMGFSVGANVLAARYYGSRSYQDLRETVHTTVLISILGGLLFSVIGLCIAPPLLRVMGTPEEILPKAVLYMRVCFAGLIFTGIYNFGSAILRSVGDTRRPLYFLLIAGVINVILNLLFVVVFHAGVAGVALATTISNGIAGGLILYTLAKTSAPYSLSFKELHIHKDKLILLAKIGIPAGINGIVFSLSNVLVQSSVNSFGPVVMAGHTAASNIESFGTTALSAFHHAALAAISQSLGARKPDRVRKTMLVCGGCVIGFGLFTGIAVTVFREPLLSLYTSDAAVIEVGMRRILFMGLPMFMCGLMDMMVGVMRGMGYSMMPTVVSMLGACGTRVLWIYTVFVMFPTYEVLLLAYIVSWTLTVIAHLVCYFTVRKRVFARYAPEKIPA